MSEEDIRKVAKARVGFRVHAMVYVIVNAFLVAIWAITSYFGADTPPAEPFSFWPVWPMLGWGVGLAIHGFVVYGGGLAWEQREEERIRRQQGMAPKPR